MAEREKTRPARVFLRCHGSGLEALVEEPVVDLEQPLEEPLEEPLEQVQEVEVAGNPVEERPHEAQVLLAKSN